MVVGDVVQLKSGSPSMTVVHLSEPKVSIALGSVQVAWHEHGQPRREIFPEEALKKINK